jgi:hypothetical protein
VDPEVQQTEQAYLYAGDDPVDWTDPMGMCGDGWWEVWCPLEAAWDWVTAAIVGVPAALESLGGWTKGEASDLTRWLLHNRGLVVSLGAVAACLAPVVGLIGCGIATAFAFGVRAQQRGRSGFEADAVDLLVTAGSFGLVNIPTSLGIGEAPAGLYSLLGRSKADADLDLSQVAKWVLKVHGSTPDLLAAVLLRVEREIGRKK